MNLSNNKTYLYLIGILSSIAEHIKGILIAALSIIGYVISILFMNNGISFTSALLLILGVSIVVLLLLSTNKKGN